MAQQISTRIKDFLTENKQDKTTITDGTLKRLITIDTAIQRRLTAISNAKQTLQKNRINVSAIAKETGISNKTFYNNKLLKEFVLKYSANTPDNTSTEPLSESSEIIQLREQNAELNRRIKLLVERDVDLEKLHVENEELQKELKEREATCRQLQETNEQLRARLKLKIVK